MVSKVNAFRLLACMIICQFAGIIGSVFTASSLESWYVLLEKPGFNPRPGYSFPYGIYFIRLWEYPFTLYGNMVYSRRRSRQEFSFSSYN